MSTTRIPRFERGRSAHDLRGGGRLNKRKKPKNIATHGTGDDDTRMLKKGEGAGTEMKRRGTMAYRVIKMQWLTIQVNISTFKREGSPSKMLREISM